MAEKIVIVGNGMVGHRFCETLIEQGIAAEKRVIVFGGEPRPAYDRVHLSSWFGEEPVDLTLQSESWYHDNGIELRLGDPVTAIDRSSRTVTTASGHCEPYDRLILATGSSALMPPLPGMDRTGVLKKRTDLFSSREKKRIPSSPASGYNLKNKIVYTSPSSNSGHMKRRLPCAGKDEGKAQTLKTGGVLPPKSLLVVESEQY